MGQASFVWLASQAVTEVETANKGTQTFEVTAFVMFTHSQLISRLAYRSSVKCFVGLLTKTD